MLWQLLHWLFFTRAASRGPSSFAKYEMRRQLRRTLRGQGWRW